jgi:hypothetical protein
MKSFLLLFSFLVISQTSGSSFAASRNCCLQMKCSSGLSCNPRACECMPDEGYIPAHPTTHCPRPACEPLRKGCSYGKPSVNLLGCQNDCGPVVCPSPQPSVPCPVPDCAAPPQGCNYSHPHFDHNGCQLDCGNLICATETPICSVPSCPNPPDHCQYGPPRFDVNGCQQDCGTLTCTQ